MTVLPVHEVRANFSAVTDEIVKTHDRVTVTRNGLPAIVMLSDEDFEGMQLTIETLSDSDEMAAIAEGLADLRAGRTVSGDQMAEVMRETGRA
jgi:prevent-host-death family protein